MLFTETRLKDAYIIDLERRADSRGFFARGLCQRESAAHGLKPIIAQVSVCLRREERDNAACTHMLERVEDSRSRTGVIYARCFNI